jgi:hypothetical protein
MNDLLINVHQNEAYDGPEIQEDDGDIEEGPPEAPPTDDELSMKEFFRSVEDIKKDMNGIRALQREVTELHDAGKTMVKTKEVQRHQETMQVRTSNEGRWGGGTAHWGGGCMHGPSAAKHLSGNQRMPARGACSHAGSHTWTIGLHSSPLPVPRMVCHEVSHSAADLPPPHPLLNARRKRLHK